MTKAMPARLRFALRLPIARARKSRRSDLTTTVKNTIPWRP